MTGHLQTQTLDTSSMVSKSEGLKTRTANDGAIFLRSKAQVPAGVGPGVQGSVTEAQANSQVNPVFQSLSLVCLLYLFFLSPPPVNDTCHIKARSSHLFHSHSHVDLIGKHLPRDTQKNAVPGF